VRSIFWLPRRTAVDALTFPGGSHLAPTAESTFRQSRELKWYEIVRQAAALSKAGDSLATPVSVFNRTLTPPSCMNEQRENKTDGRFGYNFVKKF
jgi:hypothetical protein